MRFGYYILNVFASLWAIGGMAAAGEPLWTWIAPPLISVAIILSGTRIIGRLPRRYPAEGKRIGRLIGICSGIEGIAITIANIVLSDLHAAPIILPVITIIVGLHFFPLAWSIPVKAYYTTGAVITLIGAAAVIMPSPTMRLVVAFGTASAPWVTALWVLAGAQARIRAETNGTATETLA